MATRLVWTQAGFDALPNDDNTGTSQVLCAYVAVGTGTTPATKADTALEAEIKRVGTISGQAVDSDVIHVVYRDETADNYAATEIGLISDDGVLLARYAQADAIIEKAAGSTALLPIDAALTDVDATQITFPSTEFVNPPWSEQVKGVSKRATQAQAEGGVDNSAGTSPLRVFQAIAKWLGKAAPANTYPISITGRAAVADQADEASHADMASNASQLGGKMPADYRDASQLTGTAPASVLPAATTHEPGAVRQSYAQLTNQGNTSSWSKIAVIRNITDQQRYTFRITAGGHYGADADNEGTAIATIVVVINNAPSTSTDRANAVCFVDTIDADEDLQGFGTVTGNQQGDNNYVEVWVKLPPFARLQAIGYGDDFEFSGQTYAGVTPGGFVAKTVAYRYNSQFPPPDLLNGKTGDFYLTADNFKGTAPRSILPTTTNTDYVGANPVAYKLLANFGNSYNWLKVAVIRAGSQKRAVLDLTIGQDYDDDDSAGTAIARIIVTVNNSSSGDRANAVCYVDAYEGGGTLQEFGTVSGDSYIEVWIRTKPFARVHCLAWGDSASLSGSSYGTSTAPSGFVSKPVAKHAYQ